MPMCDNVDTRQECLVAITTANYKRTPIHTIYISNDAQGSSFMQALAELNRGTYSRPQEDKFTQVPRAC